MTHIQTEKRHRKQHMTQIYPSKWSHGKYSVRAACFDRDVPVGFSTICRQIFSCTALVLHVLLSFFVVHLRKTEVPTAAVIR